MFKKFTLLCIRYSLLIENFDNSLTSATDPQKIHNAADVLMHIAVSTGGKHGQFFLLRLYSHVNITSRLCGSITRRFGQFLRRI
jgi:hypothetical protein